MTWNIHEPVYGVYMWHLRLRNIIHSLWKQLIYDPIKNTLLLINKVTNESIDPAVKWVIWNDITIIIIVLFIFISDLMGKFLLNSIDL